MLNLASLSALLRTLRQDADGAVAAVERVPHVRRVAAEGEMQLASQFARGGEAHRLLAPAVATADAATRAASTLLPAGAAADPGRQAGPHGSGAPAREATAARGGELLRLAAAAPPVPRFAPETMAASAALALTRGGALVSEALRLRAPQAPQPASVAAREPLVASPRVPVVELARALARSLADSGLFYESHLARWARREYPASALAREPQALWRTPDSAPAGGTAASALPEAAATLLTRQLDALDSRQVTWSGQPWPGQHASITFEEASDAADRPGADDDDKGAPPAQWRTRIDLTLPSLGRVSASLALAGSTLHVGLHATDALAVDRLAAAEPQLAAALAGSRIALAGLAVEAHAEG